jgi:uncharacterized membrane protein
MKSKNKILLVIVLILLIASSTYRIFAVEEAQSTVQPLEEITNTKAKIVSIGNVYDVNTGNITDKVQDVTVEILEGKYKGQRYDATYILSYDIDNKIMAYELDKGNTVFVEIHSEGDSITKVVVHDMVRQNYIIWMLGFFFLSILIIGRKKGLKAIIGLAVTILSVFFIMIAYIYKGYSPIIISIATSTFIIIITFIIIAGLNKKALTAAIGTTGGVIFSGVIAFVFGILAKLSGAQEEAVMLSMNSSQIIFNFRELLFAGIVVASLGACMDVGMSIASALDELKQKNPDMNWKELLKSGMNIGGDVIGTMTNTLILAYVGGSLSLILLFMSNNMSIAEIINKETIASDAISAIAGSMGVIYTIPITTICYALLNRKKTSYKKKSENIVDGKRSLKI